MRKYLLLPVCLLLTLFSKAQSPCGTVLSPEMAAWLNDYIDHPEKYPNTANARSVSYIPVKFHIVGTDQGTGYYKLTYLWQIVCELNEKYAPVGFYFYIYGGVEYINNSEYYIHDYNAGDQMMETYNVDNVVNVYIVNGAAGNCGYYTYGPDAIAVALGCMNPGSTTLAHELGHYFSLPHPFDKVNGQLEYVDESNCNSGGDLFCDTRADILDYRWYCPYLGGAVDPHGDAYDPDETLFMSYSLDNCQNRFTTQQSNAMTNFLLNDRHYLLNFTVPPTAAITDPVVKISPEANAANVPNDWVEFVWDQVPNATFYQLQATKYNSFYAPLAINTIVYGTSFTTWLESDKTYEWRVLPLSEGYTCTSFSSVDTFTTVLGTGVQPVVAADAAFKIYPTIATSGNSIHILFNAEKSAPSEIHFISINGTVVKNMPVEMVHGENDWTVSTSGLPPGMYLIKISSEGKIYQQKVAIAQ